MPVSKCHKVRAHYRPKSLCNQYATTIAKYARKSAAKNEARKSHKASPKDPPKKPTRTSARSTKGKSAPRLIASKY